MLRRRGDVQREGVEHPSRAAKVDQILLGPRRMDPGSAARGEGFEVPRRASGQAQSRTAEYVALGVEHDEMDLCVGRRRPTAGFASEQLTVDVRGGRGARIGRVDDVHAELTHRSPPHEQLELVVNQLPGHGADLNHLVSAAPMVDDLGDPDTEPADPRSVVVIDGQGGRDLPAGRSDRIQRAYARSVRFVSER